MNDVAIRVENLGKMYRIGGPQEQYQTFRDVITHTAAAPFRRARDLIRGQAYGAAGLKEEIWALKDLSFEVKHGEVVGIIGRNGAGKSTLLKILSRITEPTTGYIDIYGRVGALLEVGTGFHPELTGRENIFLNGAILGMSREEIKRKFDEIVSFAGVEKFIDTPVKHYSSGMGLRLGFAVAAHLEPEILIVDEVLAVGDAEFQKKSMGKMSEVAGEGRTVLLVSHNMAAISNLCTQAIYLKEGKVEYIGNTPDTIDKYSSESMEVASTSLSERVERRGNGNFRFTGIRSGSGNDSFIHAGGKVCIEIDYSMSISSPGNVSIAIGFDTLSHVRQFTLWSKYSGDVFSSLPESGTFVCEIPALPLKSGNYLLHLYIDHNGDISDYLEHACILNVEYAPLYLTGLEPTENQGVIILPHTWRLK